MKQQIVMIRINLNFEKVIINTMVSCTIGMHSVSDLWYITTLFQYPFALILYYTIVSQGYLIRSTIIFYYTLYVDLKQSEKTIKQHLCNQNCTNNFAFNQNFRGLNKRGDATVQMCQQVQVNKKLCTQCIFECKYYTYYTYVLHLFQRIALNVFQYIKFFQPIWQFIYPWLFDILIVYQNFVILYNLHHYFCCIGFQQRMNYASLQLHACKHSYNQLLNWNSCLYFDYQNYIIVTKIILYYIMLTMNYSYIILIIQHIWSHRQ
eukprot:TRINITY_DN3141_c0_g1_i3.p2 TRINITY_DN3141_c0_g1~~TRINITY_DN3141_c0_g1_i3.p2  ORF type:complete len:263 (+),score=-30.48 TRINITY_DN3141_c0_g1_i3:1010-1798(+)